MKFNFKIQQYQTDAVNAVVNVFNGQGFHDRTTYLRDLGDTDKAQASLIEDGLVYKNELINLSDQQLLDNIRKIQNDNNISLSDKQISINLGDKTQMLIESGKASIQIDKTTIEITGDISGASGKIMIEAKNEASISATSVNIKGKSGVSIN